MKIKNNFSVEDDETLKKFDNNLINRQTKNFKYFNLVFIVIFNVLVIIGILNIKKHIESLESSLYNKIQNLDEYIKNQDNTIKYQETQIKNQDNMVTEYQFHVNVVYSNFLIESKAS